MFKILINHSWAIGKIMLKTGRDFYDKENFKYYPNRVIRDTF
jgi:hypothetical protein